MEIEKQIKKNEKLLLELYRHFHKYPELSLNEYRTSEFIVGFLNDLGIKNKMVGKTGVYAYIEAEEKQKTIALRCDIDALPIQEKTNVDFCSINENVMHACGHDAHLASLLIATKILWKNRKSLKVNIKLFFQQAEEIGKGAEVFIKNGLLENVDEILGIHIEPNMDSGKISVQKGVVRSGVEYFKIEIFGNKSHVSKPNLGNDALLGTCKIVCELQSLVNRLIKPTEPLLIGIGKINSGDNYNIVAGEGFIEGTIRSVNLQSLKLIKTKIRKVVNGICLVYGLKSNIIFEHFADPVVNNEEICNFIKSFIKKEDLVEDLELSLGGDDFGYMLNLVKGAYIQIGNKNKKIIGTEASLHNECFRVDEAVLKKIVYLYIKFAIEQK